MRFSMRWLIAFLVVMSLLGGTSVAMAAEAGEAECPQQVGDGVICTGPTLPADVEPGSVQATATAGQLDEPPTLPSAGEDECPIPVGDGVICTGPTLPGGEPANGQSITFDFAVFLPVMGS